MALALRLAFILVRLALKAARALVLRLFALMVHANLPAVPTDAPDFEALLTELREHARELREKADRLDAEAREARAAADEDEARLAEAAALIQVALRGRLPSSVKPSTPSAMSASAIDPDVLKSRANIAPEYRGNRFLAAMVEDNETIEDVAKYLTGVLGYKVKRTTVQGWYVPVGKTAHRRIPRAAAEALLKKYGKDKRGRDRVPLSSWPRIRD